jgi:hypothetical protein
LAPQQPNAHRELAVRDDVTFIGVGRPTAARVFLLRSQRQRERRRIARSPARRTARRAQQEHPHRPTPRVRAEQGLPRARLQIAGDPAVFPITLAPEDTALHQGISPATPLPNGCADVLAALATSARTQAHRAFVCTPNGPPGRWG